MAPRTDLVKLDCISRCPTGNALEMLKGFFCPLCNHGAMKWRNWIHSSVRHALAMWRGDWVRATGYGESTDFVLPTGTFPRHITGVGHLDEIRESVDAFVNSCPVEDVLVIVDIGSLNGIESCLLADAFPSSKVYAFEPVPESVEEIRWITRDRGNIEVIHAAVSDQNGMSDFFVTRNRGTSSLLRPKSHGPASSLSRPRKITVPTVRLDDWARPRNIERIDLVWMDVQGSEDRVLAGMGKLLATVLALKTEIGRLSYYEGHAMAETVYPILMGAGLQKVRDVRIDGWEEDSIWLRQGDAAC